MKNGMSGTKLVLAAGVLLFGSWSVAAHTAGGQVVGVVVDASGAPIVGAEVELRVAGTAPRGVQTGAGGRFEFNDVPPGEAILSAGARGFADTTAAVPPQPARGAIRIVLSPAPLAESVTITAARGADRLATPAAANVLTAADLLNSAAGALDDALRSTPGFSLFRRSSSRTANPTTQGVTLRGLAGSGASRTFVLADGLPLNDPFGSWVYWNRVPQAAVERVEVVRGAAGDLYGPDALGGVIQVLTFQPTRRQVRALADAASHGTGRVSLLAAGRRAAWSAAAAGEWLDTDGVPVVARADRGVVDIPAVSDYRSAFVVIEHDRGPWRGVVRGSVSAERRGNGTPLQVNETDWRQLSGESGGTAGGGTWVVRTAGGTQRYDQTFSALSAGRSSERLTTEQHISSAFLTGSGQWVRSWSARVLLVGAEARRVESDIDETRYSFAGVPSSPEPFGGTETSLAAFGRTSVALSDTVLVVAGARIERWASDPLQADHPSHRQAFFSPRVSVLWQASRTVSAHAAAYRAYRTPTLNELHRGFRVGSVVTNANPRLDPERLTGADASVLVAIRRGSARLTGFWNHLDEAITNVTLSVTPALITRERRNADRVRATGVELEADLRPHRVIWLTAQATLTWSRFRASSEFPELEGNRVPQVPRYQLGAGVTYADPRTLTLAAQVRVTGAQFDDDLNELKLNRFAVVDAHASRAVKGGLHVFAAVENLFDSEYDVGRTPVRTIGWPRTVRAGLRLFLP